MVYSDVLVYQYGFVGYIIMTVIILSTFFIHQFSKVVIANTISADCVKTGVPIKKFIEPIGFVLMFILGIGWSNGPELNPVYFKDRKKDTLKIYLGAILVNIVIGIISILCFYIFNNNMHFFILRIFGLVNLSVGVMNLIPMNPFSGYYVFYELSSPNTKMWLINNKNMIVLFFMLGLFFDILPAIMNITVENTEKLIYAFSLVIG